MQAQSDEDLLMEAIGGRVILAGINADGFQVVFPRKPEQMPEGGIDLIQKHSDRLRAILDMPVLVSMHWEDGDEVATCSIIPANGKADDPDEPFKTFTLKFPGKKRWPRGDPG